MTNKEILQEYNNRLTENNILLSNILRDLKKLPNSDGSVTATNDINVFTQDSEPVGFEGIWFKTSDEIPYQIETVIGSPGDTLVLDDPFDALPADLSLCCTYVVGDYLYVIGGSSIYDKAYKCNVNTMIMEQIANPPVNIADAYYAVVGHSIYMFGGAHDNYQACKFDADTETYTVLKDSPSRCINGFAVAVGTDIHLIGSYYSRSQHIKYDTLTDTYTNLTSLPHDSAYARGCAIGTDIYVFGGISSSYAYKYDTLTDTYKDLTTTPYVMFNHLCFTTNGKYIFLVGTEANSHRDQVAVYDVSKNTYKTYSGALPFELYNSSIATSGSTIYIVGGIASGSDCSYIIVGDNSTMSWTISDGILLAQSDSAVYFRTQLFNNDNLTNRLTCPFIGAYVVKDSQLQTNIETYYGDGTDWIKL